MKLTKVRTILFTEACPLACRYCYLKDDDAFGEFPTLTHEQFKDTVELYDKTDNPDEVETRLLFTGGEPFLYWEWIKEVISQYGNRFQYSFNTSGYLFTEEILEFLSHYHVNFILSVDGDEKLTNYLRPVVGNKYKVGYLKQLKTVLPTLLYYFPQTPFRIIVNPRYVDLMHAQYLEAERLGFKYFTFVLDFECRPDKPIDGKLTWKEEHTQILQEQFDLIVQEIVSGFYYGIAKPQIVEVNKAISFLLNEKPYDVNDLPCQVFAGRSTVSVQAPESHNYCMAAQFPDMEDAKVALIQSYNEQNHQCQKDKDCPVFEYCAQQCCPQLCIGSRSGFFDFDDLECIVNKITYMSAMKILYLCNECCPDAKLYKRFINTFDYPGKKEVF